MDTVAVVALVLGVVNALGTAALILFCLILLHPSDDRYTELAKRVDKQDRLLDLCGTANSQLFRYVERLDDATGGTGHHVLLPNLPSSTPRRHDHGAH